MRNPGGAVFVLIFTVIAAASLFSDVYRQHRIASYPIIPYILWLCFALYLNL